MTITTNPTRNEYTATAGQTVFSYTFKIFEDTDLNVYQTAAGVTANDTTDLITAYTVAGAGDEDGGTITLTTPASAGDLITIVSDIPASRTTDYQNNGDFRPTAVNDDFDRVVSLVKQVEDLSNRSILFQEAQQGVSQLDLPAPLSGYYMRWKADLSGLENVQAPTIYSPSVTYSTYADAQAATGLTNGQVAWISGRTTFNDGGQGVFVWSSADLSTEVAADPQRGVYVPLSGGDGSGGAWVRQYDGTFVDLSWFGAKGDGVSDDTTIIQSVLDSFLNIYFSSVQYRTTSALEFRSGHYLKGSSAFGTLLTVDTLAVSGLVAETSGSAPTTFVTIEDIRVYNSVAATTSGAVGIDLTDVSNSKLIRCRVRYFEDGIAMAGLLAGYYNSLYDCEIASCESGLTYGNAGNSNRVFGGRISGCLYGVNIDNVNDFHIDTTIENCEYGINIGSNVIDGTFRCRFEGNGDVLGTSTRNPLAGAVVIASGAENITDLGSHYSAEADKVLDYSRKLLTLSRGNSGAIDGGVHNPNMIANPTMTNVTAGVANGWTVTPSIPAGTTYSGDVVTKETGSRSQKIEITSSSSLSHIYTALNVEIGVPCTVTARVKTNEDLGWRMLVGRTLGGSEYRLALVRDNNNWQTLSATFVPITSDVYIYFQMQSGTETTVGATLNIDSISATYGLIPGIPGVKQKQIVPHGTTAARHSLPQIGEQFFDTTLGYIIWYDGTNWVDASGSSV